MAAKCISSWSGGSSLSKTTFFPTTPHTIFDTGFYGNWEFSHIGAAYGAEQGAEYVDDDCEGKVEDEKERGPVVAVKVGQDCTLRRLDLDRTRSPSLRLNLDAKSTADQVRVSIARPDDA